MKPGWLISVLLLVMVSDGLCQVPVELFTGHEKTTIDLQFFRYVKQSNGQNSRWLFFNRNRASIDYAMTSKTSLPQFGFTEALSYNHPALKGFAPVAVVQVFNLGVFPKAGIQYARVRENLVIFSCGEATNHKLKFRGDFDTEKLTFSLHFFRDGRRNGCVSDPSR